MIKFGKRNIAKFKKERKLNQKKEYPKKLESQKSSWSKFETIHSRLS